MNHVIMIVGEELHINKPFLNYFFNEYEMHFGEIGIVHYVQNSDKEIPFYIEKYSNNFEHITILANDANFHTISKILATLTTDMIELKDGNLIPSRTIKFEENSFLIELNNAKINTIKVTPTHKLPKFLIENQTDCAFFNIIDTDKDSVKILLEPLTSTYNVTTNITQLIPDLIHIKAQSIKYGQLSAFINAAKNLFYNKFIDEKNVVDFVAKQLMENNLKITFAESCTGGLCAAKICDFPGISQVFDGSIISYCNEIKHSLLGVSDETLVNFGAVSEQCVKQMSIGALKMYDSDFAISISGIAGPDGGNDEKPVGTVYIALAQKNGAINVKKLNLSGDRNYIREQSALYAFVWLTKHALLNQ